MIGITQDRSAAETPAVRFDVYRDIHKALRAAMSETLLLVGRTDPADADGVRIATGVVRDLLAKCLSHVAKENGYVHPAIEAAAPGTTTRIAGEHEHHLEAVAALEADIVAVERSGPASRDAAMLQMYRHLALFVADNFAHMHVEETVHNAALWAAYSDAELVAIEQAIVASVPPPEMMDLLRWMIPSITPGARANLFAGMRAGMPPEAFSAVVGLARTLLEPGDVAKLDAALAGATPDSAQDPMFAAAA